MQRSVIRLADSPSERLWWTPFFRQCRRLKAYSLPDAREAASAEHGVGGVQGPA